MEESRKKWLRSHKAKMMRQKAAPVPEYYPLSQYLLVDSFDNLWVFTNAKKNEDLFSVDVFDKAGNYKQTFILANRQLVKYGKKIKVVGNYLFALINDPERGEFLMRYALPGFVWK